VRSGDEPMHARSPLRVRLISALVGVVVAGGLALRTAQLHRTAWAVLFTLVAVGALANAAVVVRRLRSGPHFQPGSDVPPYRPAAPGTTPRVTGPVPEGARRRRYLILMAVCLTLLVTAWFGVRLVSVPLAVGMSVVAMLIPPVAAIVANAGWRGDDDGPR